MRLFDKDKVKKFFNILGKKKRYYKADYNIYKGYDKNNPDYNYCEQDVFVNRTVHKWFSGKYLIYFDPETELKKYYLTTRIEVKHDYSINNLTVYLIDYGNISSLINTKIVNEFIILSAEGIWIDDPKEYHDKVLSMFSFTDLPDNEYIFRAYDFSKYPKRGVSREKALKKIETTISFIAKTESQAYNMKKNYKSNLTITDLIETREL